MYNFIKSFLKSWKYAWDGIKFCFGKEQNLTLMTLISVVVVICGFYFKISLNEWIAVVMLITAVLSLELFNTSFEHFLNLFHPEINTKVKNIKDLIAGGVAIVSIGAAVIGSIIFIPKIIILFQIYF